MGLLAASKLLSLGLPILWLQSPKKASYISPAGPVDIPPERRGKKPVAEGWASQEAADFEELVRVLGPGEPGYNIGVRTGKVAGAGCCVIVVDLDSDSAVHWASANLPVTQIKVFTAKGQHWYYRAPAYRVGNKVRLSIVDEDNQDKQLDLDIRGDGGLVVAPPSIHGTGVQYTMPVPWTRERIDSMPIFDMAWFGQAAKWEGIEDKSIPEGDARMPPRYVDLSFRRKRAIKYLDNTPGTISGQGTASNACLYAARVLVYGLCIPPDEAALILHQHQWNTKCQNSNGEPYPWSIDELQHKCQDAYRLVFDKPYGWMLIDDKEVPDKPKTQDEVLADYVKEETDRELASIWWDFNVKEQDVESAKINYAFTDTGNAERLVLRYGESIRWLEERQVWYVYDEAAGRWIDRRVALDRCSKVVARKILEEAGPYEEREAQATARKQSVEAEGNADPAITRQANEEYKTATEAKKGLYKWQKSSESVNRRQGMVTLAASEPSIALGVDCFDSHPFLLIARSCVVDMRDKVPKTVKHSRDFYFTKTTAAKWDPKAECPTWQRCLKEWMQGDDEMISFLQRIFGYSITGSTQEEKMFIFSGSGSNGKSTAINAIQSVLGSYAMAAPASILMETGADKATPSNLAALAALVGLRMVIASESDDSAKLAEAQVKKITCQDMISACKKFQAPFEFKPTHKVFLMTNSKPIVTGTDDGIWRRIMLVEWNHQVVGDKIDHRLAEKLLAERPGIFNWLVKGVAMWKEQGLEPPKRVKTENLNYRYTQDSFARFFEETLEMCEGERLSKQQVRNIYEEWCRNERITPLGGKRFTAEMEKRGISGQVRSATERFWAGIRVQMAVAK